MRKVYLVSMGLFILIIATMVGCSTITPAIESKVASKSTALPTTTIEPTVVPASESTVAPSAEPISTPTGEPSDHKLGTRSAPNKINKEVSLVFTGVDDYAFNLTLTQIIRGDEAWKIVKEGNPNNKIAPNNQEYLLAKFKIKISKTDNDTPVNISSHDFSLVATSGRAYSDFVSVSGLKPEFTKLYVGASGEGFASFLVDKSDISPAIVLMSETSGGVWFATNEAIAENKSTVSEEEFVKITEGMTYNEVAAIIGGEGKVASKDDATTIYEFNGEGKSGSIVSFKFHTKTNTVYWKTKVGW